MQKATTSLRAIGVGVIPQVVYFGLLAEAPKCREPHRGNLLYPRKCSLSFAKSLEARRPICGKMDTPTALNVPLEMEIGSKAGSRRNSKTAPGGGEGTDWRRMRKMEDQQERIEEQNIKMLELLEKSAMQRPFAGSGATLTVSGLCNSLRNKLRALQRLQALVSAIGCKRTDKWCWA